MRIVYFTHSLASCWNHGNAHFVRGVLDELVSRGHEVRAFEPEGAWSLTNLLADHGPEGLQDWRRAYPRLRSRMYRPDDDLAQMVEGADLVIVHEWNEPELVARLGRMRARGSRWRLLFHDTHHRAVSAPHEMARYDLEAYDGVLAFGEALSEVYRGLGWGRRVWTWHEAADIHRFHPPLRETEPRRGLVWIGNWGDGERTAEIEEFLLRPSRAAALPLHVHGVRYPPEALALLAQYGATYHGWLANAAAPGVFAYHLATVHVPRRYYATMLPGIPTIRVFEALACGIPLVTAPWDDAEHLFTLGQDYLVGRDAEGVANHLFALHHDRDMRQELAAHGLATIRARHTCAHRASELLNILASLKAEPAEGVTAA